MESLISDIYTHIPDTSLKNYCESLHPQHIPQSYSHYKAIREENIQFLLKHGGIKESEEFNNQNAVSISEIYPNPTNGTFDLKFEAVNSGHVSIEIYSVLGRRIQELSLGEIQIGNHNRKITVNSNAPGMYYISVKHNNTVQDTKKIVLM